MSFFKSDNKFIYADADIIEMYIPKYYFDESSRFAEDIGDIVKSLGVFIVGIINNNKPIEYHVFNVPSQIELFVIHSEDRNIQLSGDDNEEPYKVLIYQKGQKIMVSSVIENSSNVEAFMNFILKGKLPSLIPYEKSIEVWRKNQELNSVNLGVTSTIEELVLSVAYRYKNDPGIKYSHALFKNPDLTPYDYVMNNIRQICQYTSTFSALTFEDIDSMITTSLNRTRTKGNEAFSPVEMLLKL